jgi:HK97 family phage major capsid protein
MKKLAELKAKKAALMAELREIGKSELTTEVSERVDAIEAELATVNKDLKVTLMIEQANMEEVEGAEPEAEEAGRGQIDLGASFRDFLNDAVAGKGQLTFRADPIITTTDTDMITKSVAGGIDVLTSPGEEFLRTLGVTFYEGLNGNFAVPSMAEDLATFPGEDASAASAGMTPDSLVLAARRVTHTQSISRETLAQTNPGVYAAIVQNLVNGIGNALVKDVMATVISDAATQLKTTGTTLTYTNIVDMEASIGGLSIGNAAYVTTPTGKSFLKRTVVLGTDNGPIWQKNEVNGYPAYSAPQLAANKVIFGDWSKEVVGKWGSYEIIVDPYTDAKKGLINLTIVALVDSGNANKRAFAIVDASLA